MKYYRLMDELYIPENRWFLRSLNVVDENKISVWKFVSPANVELPTTEKLKVSIREEGIPLDFTFADFGVLIVNERVAFLLNEDECQLIPVDIEGVKNNHTYFVAVVLNSINCVDETRSNFEKWQTDDPVRPDLAGEYKSIYKLFIDGKKVNGNNIFRLKKSDNIIVINESLKNKFEKIGISGVKFRDVT